MDLSSGKINQTDVRLFFFFFDFVVFATSNSYIFLWFFFYCHIHWNGILSMKIVWDQSSVDMFIDLKENQREYKWEMKWKERTTFEQ